MREKSYLFALELLNEISFEAIEGYLNSANHFPSCKKCIPLMGFGKIPPGSQKNHNIDKQLLKAIEYLREKTRPEKVSRD